jgi:hypothetical protein
MPVERGPQINLRSALVLGLSGVFVAGALFVFVAWLAGSGGVEVQLGDDEFENLQTERIAAEIADRGPILFSDVAGGDRDIILQHLGDDLEHGWLAFDAQQPGADRSCFFAWNPDDEVFVETCDGTVLPPDGGDQPTYEVYLVDEGERLVVDLNDVRSTTTVGVSEDR